MDAKRRDPIARLIRFMMVALILSIGATGTVQAQQATPTSGAGPSWLMIQAFDAATLRLDPTTKALSLTLTGVDPSVLAFTDRPNRKVATLRTADFARLVAKAETDPLNATLVAPLGSGQDVMLVMELRNVELAATGGSVTYKVTVLAEENQTPSPEASPIVAQNNEVAFGGGHLFVDNLQVPVDVPVNLCGNTVNVVGFLNPAFGNTCVNH